MKKIPLILFLLVLSLNSSGNWNFQNSSLEGDTFYIHTESIKQDGMFVYFWYLKSYLMPNKFGDFSSKVYVQGDCNKNRLKYLTYVWFKQPMGKGLGERSDVASDWEYPAIDSSGIDLLQYVCSLNHYQ
tara:strand:- start:506 stop:892 length:387 start_codon:yes stop_codon:yes gene_type:complete